MVRRAKKVGIVMLFGLTFAGLGTVSGSTLQSTFSGDQVALASCEEDECAGTSCTDNTGSSTKCSLNKNDNCDGTDSC